MPSSPSPAAPLAPTPLHSKLVWLLATLLTSSAAILTRYANVPATSISFWRVFGAAVVLSPFCYASWKREGRPPLFTVPGCDVSFRRSSIPLVLHRGGPGSLRRRDGRVVRGRSPQIAEAILHGEGSRNLNATYWR